MRFETQKLIIELLNQEIKRADHRATRMYHKEVEEAKQDFINTMIKYQRVMTDASE